MRPGVWAPPPSDNQTYRSHTPTFRCTMHQGIRDVKIAAGALLLLMEPGPELPGQDYLRLRVLDLMHGDCVKVLSRLHVGAAPLASRRGSAARHGQAVGPTAGLRGGLNLAPYRFASPQDVCLLLRSSCCLALTGSWRINHQPATPAGRVPAPEDWAHRAAPRRHWQRYRGGGAVWPAPADSRERRAAQHPPHPDGPSQVRLRGALRVGGAVWGGGLARPSTMLRCVPCLP